MNMSPTAQAARINRPPTTVPAIVPAETGLQLHFGQSHVVGVSLAVAVGLVDVVSDCELEEKNSWIATEHLGRCRKRKHCIRSRYNVDNMGCWKLNFSIMASQSLDHPS